MTSALKNAITTHLVKAVQKYSDAFIEVPVFVTSWSSAIEHRRNPLKTNGLFIIEEIITKLLASKDITDERFSKHVVNALLSKKVTRELSKYLNPRGNDTQVEYRNGMRFMIPVAIARGQLERSDGVKETVQWMDDKFGLLLEGIEVLYHGMCMEVQDSEIPEAKDVYLSSKQTDSSTPGASILRRSKRARTDNTENSMVDKPTITIRRSKRPFRVSSHSDIDSTYRRVSARHETDTDAGKENTDCTGRTSGTKRTNKGQIQGSLRAKAGRLARRTSVRRRKPKNSVQDPPKKPNEGEDCWGGVAFRQTSPPTELSVWRDVQPQAATILSHLLSSVPPQFGPLGSPLFFAPSDNPVQPGPQSQEVLDSYVVAPPIDQTDALQSHLTELSSLSASPFDLQPAFPFSPSLGVAPWTSLYREDYEDPIFSNVTDAYSSYHGMKSLLDMLTGTYDTTDSSQFPATSFLLAPADAQTVSEDTNPLDFVDAQDLAGKYPSFDVWHSPLLDDPSSHQAESRVLQTIFPDVSGVHSEDFSDFGFSLEDFLDRTDSVSECSASSFQPSSSSAAPSFPEDPFSRPSKDNNRTEDNNLFNPTIMDLDDLIFGPYQSSSDSLSRIDDLCHDYPSFSSASSECFLSSIAGPFDDYESTLYRRLFGPCNELFSTSA